MIHPTAIIAPGAELDPTVEVGPYAVIDAGVRLGAGCRVGPHVHLTGDTVCGRDNIFHAGCVIGDAPQDLKYHGEPTRLRVGEGNIFREHVTVHRSNRLDEDTVMGSHNLLMAGSHVGHNCRLGNHVILANGVLLGGHVSVGDRAFLSGNCLVHQFVRIGTLALMQGGAAISKDLPPYCIARGDNAVCGLNIVGLRRNGFSAAQRLELKQVYAFLLRRRGGRLRDALEHASKRWSSPAAEGMIQFLAGSKRGVCMDVGSVAGEVARDPEGDGA